MLLACNDRPSPPAKAADAAARVGADADADVTKHVEATAPHRAKLPHLGELYIPTWFGYQRGTYDLIVHFHGLSKLQESNLDRSQINAAVVSINLGVGTDHYANAFREPQAFQSLLSETEAEIEKSGRAPGAKIGRIALSAWSAGFVSVQKILADGPNAERVDAVLLADGFFTSFTNVKKREINTASLVRFVALAQAANRNDKLFAITHTAIPTADYPSVEETVGKLLEMAELSKTPSRAVGPRNMKETYAVDRGSFHVRGYEGVLAGDHIKQIHAMGETLWPYLKRRWEGPRDNDGAARAPASSR
ncbi:MAG: hypothetical protein JST00_03020 [Deltaproteobacteria bacterium]|nr:hypothetical protein [Deltaproteobacteria bacterium]